MYFIRLTSLDVVIIIINGFFITYSYPPNGSLHSSAKIVAYNPGGGVIPLQMILPGVCSFVLGFDIWGDMFW